VRDELVGGRLLPLVGCAAPGRRQPLVERTSPPVHA
jgi:hypothetical protein